MQGGHSNGGTLNSQQNQIYIGLGRPSTINQEQSPSFSQGERTQSMQATQMIQNGQNRSMAASFINKLSQTIFGGGGNNQANNLNAQGQSMTNPMANRQSVLPGGPGQAQNTVPTILIYIDTPPLRNSTRQPVTDDTTVSEIVKALKQMYGNSLGSSQLNQQLRGSPQVLGSLGRDASDSNLMNMSNQSSPQVSPLCQQITKEEVGLYLLNTKASNQMLSIRKLAPQDQVYKVYKASVDAFRLRDGNEDRFKLIFARQQDIETYLKSRSDYYQRFDEENHVISQLGKSIINNKTYERKGKLQKKSLNNDKFKERQFVLDKDQLFYYKNEKQKEKNFNLIMLGNAAIHIIDSNAYKSQKYCFEIENENRKYILSTKSQYDLDQWVYAISGQIQLAKDNRYIGDMNQFIALKEKEIAQRDFLLIQKIFKPKNVIFNPVQLILLNFINDHFISELLPHLTQYLSLASEKDYQRKALEKAKEIVQHLRTLNLKIQRTQQSLQAQDGSSDNTQVENSQDYKRYKDLKPEQKIQCLFSQEDFQQIESGYARSLADSQDSNKTFQMDPKLFGNILIRIQRILRYNYLESFLSERKIELLSIPTVAHKQHLPRLNFNASSTDTVPSAPGKNFNVFEMLLKKSLPTQSPVLSKNQSQPIQQQQQTDSSRVTGISGIRKVMSDQSQTFNQMQQTSTNPNNVTSSSSSQQMMMSSSSRSNMQ